MPLADRPNAPTNQLPLETLQRLIDYAHAAMRTRSRVANRRLPCQSCSTSGQATSKVYQYGTCTNQWIGWSVCATGRESSGPPVDEPFVLF